MIPLTNPPSWLFSFASGLPLSYHQYMHLMRILTGLIVSGNKTIWGISNLSIIAPTQRAANKFFTKYQWDAKEVNDERIKELQRHDETRWSKSGFGIIDDTIIEKAGKHIEGIGKFFDHAKKRFIYGHTLVSLHYADKKTSYALDYRHYVRKGMPGFKTKIEFAIELISEAIEKLQFPASTFMFDSWYLCRDMVDCIESYKRFWIAACKSDLNILVKGRYISIMEYFESLSDSDFEEKEIKGKTYKIHHKSFIFKAFKRKRRLIISKRGDDFIFIATNSPKRAEIIISDYLTRWDIETFYKDAKQHLGLGKCQMRNLEGIKKYWYLVLMAHSALKLNVTEGILSGMVQSKSVTARVRGMSLDMVVGFVDWIKKSDVDVMEVMEMITERFKWVQS